MAVSTREKNAASRIRSAVRRRLSSRAVPAAEAPSVSRLRVLAARLTPHEWRRRMMHMTPGLLPFVLLAIPHRDPVTWFLKGPVLAITLGFVIFALRKEGLFARRDERGWPTSVLGYAIITSALLIALPWQPELGLAVTIIIAFGDGSATLAGLIARGRRLPWNRAKSWAGLTAFIACSVPLATLVYWCEARPGVPLSVALACVVPAALAAGLAESLPTRINDNIRVGATAALTMVITHGMFVGW